MEKFFRNKLHIVLGITAIVLIVALGVYLISAAHAMIQTIQAATDQNLIKQEEIVTFNLAKAREVLERKRE